MKLVITATLLATLWFASTPAPASAGGFHADVYIGVPYVPPPVYYSYSYPYPYIGAAWYGYWGPPRGYYGYGGYYGGHKGYYHGGHRHGGWGGYRGKGGHGRGGYYGGRGRHR